MDRTTLVPLPLLCAADTSVLRVEVEPSSHEIPEDEFGVAKAAYQISQLRPFHCSIHPFIPARPLV